MLWHSFRLKGAVKREAQHRLHIIITGNNHETFSFTSNYIKIRIHYTLGLFKFAVPNNLQVRLNRALCGRR